MIIDLIVEGKTVKFLEETSGDLGLVNDFLGEALKAQAIKEK